MVVCADVDGEMRMGLKAVERKREGGRKGRREGGGKGWKIYSNAGMNESMQLCATICIDTRTLGCAAAAVHRSFPL